MKDGVVALSKNADVVPGLFQALTYFRQAGARAMARFANQEAVACCEQALVVLQHLPETLDTLVQALTSDLSCATPSWRSESLTGS
jgi:hypothetical protein